MSRSIADPCPCLDRDHAEFGGLLRSTDLSNFILDQLVARFDDLARLLQRAESLLSTRARDRLQGILRLSFGSEPVAKEMNRAITRFGH